MNLFALHQSWFESYGLGNTFQYLYIDIVNILYILFDDFPTTKNDTYPLVLHWWLYNYIKKICVSFNLYEFQVYKQGFIDLSVYKGVILFIYCEFDIFHWWSFLSWKFGNNCVLIVYIYHIYIYYIEVNWVPDSDWRHDKE